MEKRYYVNLTEEEQNYLATLLAGSTQKSNWCACKAGVGESHPRQGAPYSKNPDFGTPAQLFEGCA